MTSVYRVVGPPGTGKTTYVAHQCRLAVDKFGPAGVTVCSLTRAAAREAAGRDTGLDPENIGTLHALCFRGLGRPAIIKGAHLKSWNEEHPKMAMSAGAVKRGLDGEGGAPKAKKDYLGDSLLERTDLLRQRCIDKDAWPNDVASFYTAWNEFKELVGAVDFTDLIAQGLERLPYAPGRPSALFVDEAQDLSRLEMALVQKWGDATENLVVVGDPYQALYSWRGADQHIFSGKIHKTLGQSYRIPRRVHELALSIIQRSSDWREEIVYEPMKREGSLHRLPFSSDEPDEFVHWLSTIPPDETVMILASCDYILDPIKAKLKHEGIPYGNPYSHRWNPMSKEARKSVEALLYPSRHAIRDYHGGDASHYHWKPDHLRELADILVTADPRDAASTGGIWRGRRKALAECREDLDAHEAAQLARDNLTAHAIDCVMDLNYPALRSLLRNDQETVAYTLAAVERFGWSVLTKQPRLILGTIHSVKGGEADHVAIIPDLSQAGGEQMACEGWNERDAIHRLFYVAVTRAKQSVFVLRRRGASTPAYNF